VTKGDNNSVDDRGLYAPGQHWLTKKDVVGRARGFLPYVGMVTIYMNEYPKFKVTIIFHYFRLLAYNFPNRYIVWNEIFYFQYAVLACLGLYVLVHRE
jgi:signal peptidase